MPIKKTVPKFSYFKKQQAEAAQKPQLSLNISSEIEANNKPLQGMKNRLQNLSDATSPIPPYQSKNDRYCEAWKAQLNKK